MIDRKVARRYAKVLFDLDSTKGTLEQRIVDFESIIKIMQDNKKLVKFLKSPTINLHDKKKVLQDSFKEKFDLTFLNFLFYLLQQGRFSNLNHIADDYKLMVNNFLGVWEADIITACTLDADTEAKLEEKFEKMFHKKIKLNKKINPKMIGGAILILGNEMLDWSVSGRLKKLKENLYTV